MIDYKIVHNPYEKERSIMRIKDEERRWFMGKVWTKRRAWAKKFFREDDAVSALAIIKMTGGVKEEEPERLEEPKQSWLG